MVWFCETRPVLSWVSSLLYPSSGQLDLLSLGQLTHLRSGSCPLNKVGATRVFNLILARLAVFSIVTVSLGSGKETVATLPFNKLLLNLASHLTFAYEN